MSNFLTANIAGIESMQPGDMAHGYDVNRIAAVLNGTNPLPITVGPITTTGPIVNTGDFTIGGKLIFTTAASRVVPGATSFAIRDTANANDNLLISNAGVTTLRAGLVVTAGGEIITAGNLTLTAGNLIFSGTSAKIIPGGTSLLVRDTGDANTNIAIADAGGVTFRAGLSGITTLAMTGALSGATDITGTGITTGGIVKATGAPSLGSAASGRYVGNWTTGGSPTGLTGVAGDYGLDGNEVIWVCITGGTPGTWKTGQQAYKASARASTNTTLTTSVWGTVNLATVEYDTNSNFASNTYTAPIGGFYLCFGQVGSVATATGRLGVRFNWNGTPVSQALWSGHDTNTSVNTTDILALGASDTVKLEAFQETGGNVTLGTARLVIHYLSA